MHRQYTTPFASSHSTSVATFLFLHLIYILDSGTNRRTSIDPKVGGGRQEEINNSQWGELRREVDPVRDPVEELNSEDGVPRSLPACVTGVSEDTAEATLVPDNPNINININDGSSNIMANNSNNNTRASEQAVPNEGQDLPTAVDPVSDWDMEYPK